MSNRTPKSGPDGFYPEPVLYQAGGPPMPLMWAAHTLEQQQHHLEALDTWVVWLAHHYRLDRRYVPECWTKHWELIEELSALHLAWDAAYATTAHGDAPLTWHEHFGHARVRLAEWVARAGCRPGEHRAIS
ncbi:hypothetical protein [Actinotalea sp. Marseille-Q4924]|uniref:hypothetical protein n=1 Tax=Actinotalea sp. Marseille-Q4924 TaxID=2866571 RepID=UPI001CE44D7E|nr:hypothetical protein [Actinotalea sp. Marseille-Q4924]